ncbi:hypothetical protein F5Y12DRAFT_794793 [Xylaria sp. FL1777]|nr:hypothetical protein F5Y12DRAFT_794793 [Xylaria sp. FL1777]
MADVHNSRVEDDIPRPPPKLQRHLDYWTYWYNLIVHRGANIIPAVNPPYTIDLVTNDVRPAPFSRDIDETWSCTAFLVLVVAVHHGVDTGWLFEEGYPYPPWVGRVLGRVLLTVGAAVLSTLSFEIAGSLLGIQFLMASQKMEDRIAVLLIKRFHWAQLDEDGEPLRDAHQNFLWFTDPTNRRESIRETLQGLAIITIDYFATFFIELSNQLIQISVERVISPVLSFFFAIPVDFIPKLLSWLCLPTPGSDEISDPRTLWFEYGVPIVIQFCLLVLLWLLEILYMAKAEKWAMKGWRFVDPQMTLVWQLIRATAMHLLAYTAYQLACGCIVAMTSVLPQNSWYITVINGPIVPFLGKIMPNGRIFAAALLLFFHWLLRAASILAVIHAKQFWMPYILWQTRFSVGGAGRHWVLSVEDLVNDFTLLDPTKRVTSRVAMTAVFGLRSSWPARFQLSSVIADL